ncbi:tyrosine recombinase XerC [Embleya sp. NPDC059259]|uniref:site-specific integrase n=1 Tax=unclassified Embleya TaxID=2699296 RepID=UPI0036ACADC1
MFPLGRRETVEVLPGHDIPVWEAVAWFTDESPLTQAPGEGSPRAIIDAFRVHADAVTTARTSQRLLGEHQRKAATTLNPTRRADHLRSAAQFGEMLLQDGQALRTLRADMRAHGLIAPALPDDLPRDRASIRFHVPAVDVQAPRHLVPAARTARHRGRHPPQAPPQRLRHRNRRPERPRPGPHPARRPDKDDLPARRTVADMLLEATRTKSPFPDLKEVLRRVRAGQALSERMTVGAWLDKWISGRHGIRPGSALRYESIIRVHLKPHLGHLRLDRLKIEDVEAMFDAIRARSEEIAESNILRRAALDRLAATPWKGRENRALRAGLKAQIAGMPPFRQTTGPTSLHRIKATLRAALNAAITDRKITFNCASHVELEGGEQPDPLKWTPKRVREWRRTGIVPAKVMVWTSDLTIEFLTRAAGHRLYSMWHLIAHRGLRRGEACGLPWVDVDFDERELDVSTQLVELGWAIEQSAPKSKAGVRTVSFDKGTGKVLRAHRKAQRAEREAAGNAWKETGVVFCTEDGSWLQPSSVTKEFNRLVGEFDLPPIKLHGLRHGAAYNEVDSTGDLRAAQLLFGHSSVTVTTRYVPRGSKSARKGAERSAAKLRAKGSGKSAAATEADDTATPPDDPDQ